MARPRLAIAIPSLNRARMLDAVLREFQPTCEALSVPILVVDNGSSDETPAVCAEWARRWNGFRHWRRSESIPMGRSVMSAIEKSDAEYTWLAGDDDCLTAEGIEAVVRCLSQRNPDAVVVRSIEVPSADYVDLGAPVGPQLAELLGRHAAEPDTEYRDAGEFFAARHIILPAPTVIYPTERTLATEYERYHDTHHAHIGGLFDALAVEEERKGHIEVVQLGQVCSVSLTTHHDQGKDQWSDLYLSFARGFPKWFALLPELYSPHIHIAEAHYRHIFRGVLDATPGGGDL